MNKLKPRQLDLLRFVKHYISDHGYGPSMREIADGLGWKSVSTSSAMLDSLERMGYVSMEFNRARSLRVLRPVPGEEAPADIVYAEILVANTLTKNMPESEVLPSGNGEISLRLHSGEKYKVRITHA